MSKALELKVMHDRYHASPNQRIKEQMCQQVEPYIDQLTCHLRHPHSKEDSAQVCRIGFLRAIDTYKAGKSTFSTYAFNCIRWALLTHLRNERGERKQRVEEVLWSEVKLEEGLTLEEVLPVKEQEESVAIMKLTALLSTLTEGEQDLLWDWALTKDCVRTSKEQGITLSVARSKVNTLISTLKKRGESESTKFSK